MAGLRRVAVVLGVLVVGLVFGCGGAWGALQYPFVRQLRAAPSYEEAHFGSGLAVDPVSGDTLAVASGGPAGLSIQVFDASGSLVGTWSGANTPAGAFSGGGLHDSIAVNDVSGDVYFPDGNVVDVFAASGAYVCQITGAGSATVSSSECDASGPEAPGGAFAIGALEGATVDQATGDLYVFDGARKVVDVFSGGGTYLRQVSGASIPVVGSFGNARSLAVDDSTGELLVPEFYTGVVYVFAAATGTYLETWDGSAASNPPGTPSGSFGGSGVNVAANAATGYVYVADSQDGAVDQLGSGGGYVGQIARIPGGSAIPNPLGIAVDQSTGEVLIQGLQPVADVLGGFTSVVDVFSGVAVIVPDVVTGAASGVAARSVTFNGSVNPDGIEVGSCRFEYGTSTAYGQSAGCVETVGSGTGEVSVHADVSGLDPDTAYHFRLVAGNESGTEYGSDVEVRTLAVPVIDRVASVNVTGSSVDLSARIDPKGLDTTYRFEYGSSAGYGSSLPIPDGDVGAGTTGVPVSVHVTGLTAGTTYHWRVVASSANGTVVTGDQTFVYDTSGGGLPDGRAYEMVTPVQKNGALVDNGVFIGLPDISEDGSRVILTSIQCFGDVGSCTADRVLEGQPYLFSHAPGGWRMTALAPPATVYPEASTIWRVSADAGTALFSIPTAPGEESDWWARGPEGSFLDVGPAYPSGASTGLNSVSTNGITLNATADLSRVVWLNSSEFWPFDATYPVSGVGTSVYEYVGVRHSQPILVGVSGPAGSTSLISRCGTRLGGYLTGATGSLSSDGRTVYFVALPCASGSGANAGVPVPGYELFARIDESRTVLISGRSPLDCTDAACLGSPAGDAWFRGASVDGSKVFFTSTQQLTDNASEDAADRISQSNGCSGVTGANGCNLYEYDFARPAGHELTAVSAGDSSGGGPRVQGVVAVSSDGSHVYFVAKGVLSSAANDQGQRAVDGANNLYVYGRDGAHPEGHVAFVAALPDSGSESEEWTGALGGGLANVTPDGRFLVFTSRGRLTVDDTSVTGAQQVFCYDAQTGALVRISIGEKGFNDNGNSGVGDANIVPASSFSYRAGGARSDPTMSHDGSFVFFMSPVGLTPGALDDAQIGTSSTSNANQLVYAENVYEYHDGHVYLISDGRDVGSDLLASCTNIATFSSVCLVGSDASGRNVFFTTADRLVAADTDSQVDYYDARVCTTSEPCVPAPAPAALACQGEACHGAPAGAPPGVSAGSSVFSGPGNVTVAPVASRKAAVKKRVKHRRRKPHRRRRGGRKAGNGVHRSRGGRS